MPKKKKLEEAVKSPENDPVVPRVTYTINSGIEELKIDGGLTVTREELNQVVAKINEIIRKVN